MAYQKVNCKRKWEQSLDPKIIEGKRILQLAKNQQGVKAKIVFMVKEGDECNPIQTLQMALNSKSLKTKLEQAESAIKCKVPTWNFYIENEIIASGEYETLSQANSGLLMEAYDDLKRYCFTLVKKPNIEVSVTESGCIKGAETKQEEVPKKQLSLGEKMMAKMGWNGGGLGVQEQGIIEPVAIEERVDRQCLGVGTKEFMTNITKLLVDFAKSRSTKHLVFSNKYTKEERAQIHRIAQKHSLKSKSYGKDDNRHMVIRCPLDHWHIVEHVIEEGGETDEYKLIFPTDL